MIEHFANHPKKMQRSLSLKKRRFCPISNRQRHCILMNQELDNPLYLAPTGLQIISTSVTTSWSAREWGTCQDTLADWLETIFTSTSRPGLVLVVIVLAFQQSGEEKFEKQIQSFLTPDFDRFIKVYLFIVYSSFVRVVNWKCMHLIAFSIICWKLRSNES